MGGTRFPRGSASEGPRPAKLTEEVRPKGSDPRPGPKAQAEARARQADPSWTSRHSQMLLPQQQCVNIVNIISDSSPGEVAEGPQVDPKGPPWASSGWFLLGTSPYALVPVGARAVTFYQMRAEGARYRKKRSFLLTQVGRAIPTPFRRSVGPEGPVSHLKNGGPLTDPRAMTHLRSFLPPRDA